MITAYRTVTHASTGLYKEKGSKFLAFCYPVNSEEEIAAHLAALQKEYYDARHHCYAWVLGADKQRYRANDDGEPN
ncbi:MAG: YigZ family protein, partial [Cyclobacteriaceae bacterium]|nr:YigZ family protein [Cyclobacteriaceae bacterium]